jgi:hypothetical protein
MAARVGVGVGPAVAPDWDGTGAGVGVGVGAAVAPGSDCTGAGVAAGAGTAAVGTGVGVPAEADGDRAGPVPGECRPADACGGRAVEAGFAGWEPPAASAMAVPPPATTTAAGSASHHARVRVRFITGTSGSQAGIACQRSRYLRAGPLVAPAREKNWPGRGICGLSRRATASRIPWAWARCRPGRPAW